RTSEVERHWIYSPARLTASVPVQGMFQLVTVGSCDGAGTRCRYYIIKDDLLVTIELAEGLEPPTC
ncbi:MAG: hypothetical protein O2797_08030, partial [Bacteroidetes bacterium]|nr:hypothetical protein [Bacteroidota bacterium]